MSKKSTQATRIRKEKFSKFLVGGFLIIMLLFFALFTVQHALLYVRTNSNELYEYIGHFELSKINKTRNTTYRFALANGDIITANSDIIQYNQRIEEFAELHFLYTAPQNNIFSTTNNAVAISTLDGATIFLSANDSIAEVKRGIYFGAFFTILILAINIIYWFFLVGVKPRKKRK